MKKKIVSIMLAAVLTMAALSGCGSNTAGTGSAEILSEGSSGTDILQQTNEESITAGKDLIQFIQANFAAASLAEDYNQPLYDLPADHVFEFACSEEAGYVAYDAFRVYDNSDYVNISGMTYNKNTYENGKIIVAPDGVLSLDENGSGHVNDGTWGSLNQLYLVQYIDLATGEKLDRPVVTPFTIQHDLAAPSIAQSVDDSNSYMLSWEAVPGAVEYRVYEHFGNTGYVLECKTANTFVSVEEFKTQKKSENYTDLVKQDLKNAGYEVEDDGIVFMNKGVKYDDDLKDGYFVVVAVDESGRQSGISNIADVRDIAGRLPFTICSNVVTADISSVEDIPAYVDVEMIDGSVQKMVVDYHGAQTYTYPDNELKMSIRAHVANTLFDKFIVELYGMEYTDVMADISVVTERQDELLSKVGGAQMPEVTIGTTSSEEEIIGLIEELPEDMEVSETESSESAEVEVPETESSESVETEPAEVESSESMEVELPGAEGSGELVQLLNAVAEQVQHNMELLGTDNVNTVMYASNDLQAWMAMCLITQAEFIPVPVEVFPEAANGDYVMALLMEAYRQNPTSGCWSKAVYSPEYQAIAVEYVEEPRVRLEKARQELEAAQNIADSVTNEGMTDYEKVLAINEYFRINASYDHDSTATEVEDSSVLSEQFIDAHTPYGIICNNYGVCESYSEAFILTARCAGLEAMSEVGALYGGPHEWNRVKVNGNWCVLDVTNNDTDMVINSLLNVTDAQVEGILVPDRSAIINHQNYAATDYTNEYYYVSGKAVTDMSQATDLLAEQLQTSDTAFLRIPGNTEKSEIENVLNQLAYDKGLIWSKAGSHMNILCVMK